MVIRMLVGFPATRFPCDAATIPTQGGLIDPLRNPGAQPANSYGPSHPPLRGMSKVLDAISPRPQPVLQRFLPDSNGYRLIRGVHAVLLLRDDAGAQPLEVG